MSAQKSGPPPGWPAAPPTAVPAPAPEVFGPGKTIPGEPPLGMAADTTVDPPRDGFHPVAALDSPGALGAPTAAVPIGYALPAPNHGFALGPSGRDAPDHVLALGPSGRDAPAAPIAGDASRPVPATIVDDPRAGSAGGMSPPFGGAPAAPMAPAP